MGSDHLRFLIVNNAQPHSVLERSKLEARVTFPVHQDTQEQGIWRRMGGGKDDIFIYDKCDRLAYYIPFPLSIMGSSLEEDALVPSAILATYFRSPCGPCSDLSRPLEEFLNASNRTTANQEPASTTLDPPDHSNGTLGENVTSSLDVTDDIINKSNDNEVNFMFDEDDDEDYEIANSNNMTSSNETNTDDELFVDGIPSYFASSNTTYTDIERNNGTTTINATIGGTNKTTKIDDVNNEEITDDEDNTKMRWNQMFPMFAFSNNETNTNNGTIMNHHGTNTNPEMNMNHGTNINHGTNSPRMNTNHRTQMNHGMNNMNHGTNMNSRANTNPEMNMNPGRNMNHGTNMNQEKNMNHGTNTNPGTNSNHGTNNMNHGTNTNHRTPMNLGKNTNTDPVLKMNHGTHRNNRPNTNHGTMNTNHGTKRKPTSDRCAEADCDSWSKRKLLRAQTCCSSDDGVHNSRITEDSEVCRHYGKKRCKKIKAILKCCIKTSIRDVTVEVQTKKKMDDVSSGVLRNNNTSENVDVKGKVPNKSTDEDVRAEVPTKATDDVKAEVRKATDEDIKAGVLNKATADVKSEVSKARDDVTEKVSSSDDVRGNESPTTSDDDVTSVKTSSDDVTTTEERT